MSFLKSFSMIAAVAAGLSASMAIAQVRDAGAKSRGEYGVTPYTQTMRSTTVYRAPVAAMAPTVINSNPNSSFSAEPSAPAVTGQPAGACGVANPTVTNSYSAEPSVSRSYSAEPGQQGPRVYRNFTAEPAQGYYGRSTVNSRSTGPSFLNGNAKATGNYGGMN